MDHIEGRAIPCLGGFGLRYIFPSDGAQLAQGIRGNGLAFTSNTQYATTDADFECFRNGSACSSGLCVGFWIKLLNQGSGVTSIITSTSAGHAGYQVEIENSSMRLYFTDTARQWYFRHILRLAPEVWANFAFSFYPRFRRVCIAMDGAYECHTDGNVDSYQTTEANRPLYFGNPEPRSNDISSFIVDDVFVDDNECKESDLISLRSQGKYNVAHNSNIELRVYCDIRTEPLHQQFTFYSTKAHISQVAKRYLSQS